MKIRKTFLFAILVGISYMLFNVVDICHLHFSRLSKIKANLRYINDNIEQFYEHNKFYSVDIYNYLHEISYQKLENAGITFTFILKSPDNYSLIATDHEGGKHYFLNKKSSLKTISGSDVVVPFKEIISKYDRNSPDDNDNVDMAIRRLLKIGGDETVDIFKDFLTIDDADRRLKQLVLVGLGRFGTKKALDAVREFEIWAENNNSVSQNFRFGWKNAAVDHYPPNLLKPLAICKDKNGKEWAIFTWYRLSKPNFWITQKIENDTWLPPILLNVPELFTTAWWDAKFTLGIDGDKFIVKAEGKTISFNLKDQLIDSDNDGLTDIFERAIKTDPKSPDSDDDGILDGKDGNPHIPRTKEHNTIMDIRQTAFFALFAISNSQYSISIVNTNENIMQILDEDSIAEQEYYGYGGFVLRYSKIKDCTIKKKIKANIILDRYAIKTKLKVDMISENNAIVTFGNLISPLGGGGGKLILKKIRGKWVVVGIGETWVS